MNFNVGITDKQNVRTNLEREILVAVDFAITHRYLYE